jgi:large subunit ribosomal protein L10e
MPKRPGSTSYSRQEYIRSKPQSRVTRFILGATDVEYEYVAMLVADSPAEISSSALESARVTAGKVIAKASGQPFLLRVIVYPHEIVRSHKFMGFAGADRLSQGMSRSFGRPTDRAAKVNAGQAILSIHTIEGGLETAKEALRRASKKLPASCRVVVNSIKTTKAQA